MNNSLFWMFKKGQILFQFKTRNDWYNDSNLIFGLVKSQFFFNDMPPIYKRIIRGQFKIATNVTTKMQHNLRCIAECIEIVFLRLPCFNINFVIHVSSKNFLIFNHLIINLINEITKVTLRIISRKVINAKMISISKALKSY